MTEREIESYRRRLLDLGARLKGDIAAVSAEALRRAGGEASGSLSNAPLHLADLATDHFDQEVSLGLLENEEQSLAAIAAALGRIDAGRFGLCEECGKEVPKERLDALPFASRCLECARRAERRGEVGTEPAGG
jgi:RNA polymerase-binding transcription factor DksA